MANGNTSASRSLGHPGCNACISGQLHHLSRPNKASSIRLILAMVTWIAFLTSCGVAPTQSESVPPPTWQEEFNLSDRELEATGEAEYFILVPGYQTTLETQFEKLVISVLEDTQKIGGIVTRVVEEKEYRNGDLYEISRNFYAIDPETGDVFYFGEEVDFYSQGEIIGHSGAWIAFEDDNKPGLIMPGTPVVGMKYYQELAPGKAMDRARVVSISESFPTVVGDFENCILTQESSQLNPAAIEYKTYCPGVGLVQDQSLVLTSFGYNQP